MAGPNVLNFGSKVVFVNGFPLTLPIATTNPGSAVAGDLYYNSTDNTIHYYNGSGWVSVGTVSLTGQVLNSGEIIVGNGSNLSAAVSVSGDVSLSNFGVTALIATSNSTLVTLSGLTSAPSLATVGTITSGTWQGTAIGPTFGGTGLTSYTTGDTLYASASNVLSALGIGTTGQVLTVAGDVPTWATPASSGANTALSNLASVAINTSLLPGTDDSINLGSASFSWASANIHTLNDGSGDVSVNAYTRLLVDTGGHTQLSWSTSGVMIGVDGGPGGILSIAGPSATVQVNISGQFANSAYNFNLPQDAGTTGQLLATGGGGLNKMTWVNASTGTVTTVSVVTANGFSGTVANATSTPAITLTGTLTGDVTGNLNSTALTATTNSTITTLSALSLPYAQITGAPAAITALTGDGTASGPGSAALTLATVNSNTGSFGSSTAIPTFTVNGKGLITAASTAVVVAPAGTLSGTTLNSTVVSSSLTSLGTQSQALDMGSHLINNVTTPSAGTDAANKAYVDAAVNGLTWKGPVAAYANSNVPLTGSTPLTIDGHLVADGDLLLLGNQTTAADNGEYSVSITGGTYILTANGEPTDAGDAWLVLNGTLFGDSAFVATSPVPTAAFTQFAGPNALIFNAPLVLTGNNVTITQATTSTNGYLSLTDWNTFNNKQAAGNYITALTGDATASGPGSAALTLATVNSSPGTFAIASLSVNAKGLVTAASAATTTGSGNVVLATSPTLVTPTLGAATVTSLTSTGALLIDVNSGGSALQLESSSLQRSTDGTNFITETYIDSISLTNNSTGNIAGFAFTAGTSAGVEVTYSIENGASPALVRIGTLRVAASSDGSNPSLSDMYSESGDVGVIWSVSSVGTAVTVSYTTANQTANRVMRADVKQLRY